MSDESESIDGAVKLARRVYEKMTGRPATVADAEQLTTLAIAFGAAEKAAREQCDQGVAEEREASRVEIERLKALAREGWEAAREVCDFEGLEPAERIAAALKEIEAS